MLHDRCDLIVAMGAIGGGQRGVQGYAVLTKSGRHDRPSWENAPGRVSAERPPLPAFQLFRSVDESDAEMVRIGHRQRCSFPLWVLVA
jgi:hypothetical protein